VKILYSYNKKGYEGDCWATEISLASNGEFKFIPFNHQYYLDPSLYDSAVKLDALYRNKDVRLFNLYKVFEEWISKEKIDAIIVANCPPYHPDFLRKLNVYKVLYSADDPGATYAINIPYLHAYNHVFFVSPTYSSDMNLKEKMNYCGMRNADWLPISVFDFEFSSNPYPDHEGSPRDIDLIYVGGFWRQKIQLLTDVKKAFGARFKLYGFFHLKHNLYLNVKYGFGSWISPITHQERVQIYRRSKIGFNIHWSDYGLGNQRLYHLPANGVMQISDCADSVNGIFERDKEIVSYKSSDDLVRKIKYYLDNNDERESIARAGWERVMLEYRFKDVTRRAGALIKLGINNAAQF